MRHLLFGHSLAKQPGPLHVHVIEGVVHSFCALTNEIDDHVGSADGIPHHFLIANLKVLEHDDLQVCVDYH